MNKTQMCEYFVSEKKLMICYSFWTIHSFLRANLFNAQFLKFTKKIDTSRCQLQQSKYFIIISLAIYLAKV